MGGQDEAHPALEEGRPLTATRPYPGAPDALALDPGRLPHPREAAPVRDSDVLVPVHDEAPANRRGLYLSSRCISDTGDEPGWRRAGDRGSERRASSLRLAARRALLRQSSQVRVRGVRRELSSFPAPLAAARYFPARRLRQHPVVDVISRRHTASLYHVCPLCRCRPYPPRMTDALAGRLPTTAR